MSHPKENVTSYTEVEWETERRSEKWKQRMYFSCWDGGEVDGIGLTFYLRERGQNFGDKEQSGNGCGIRETDETVWESIDNNPFGHFVLTVKTSTTLHFAISWIQNILFLSVTKITLRSARWHADWPTQATKRNCMQWRRTFGPEWDAHTHTH